MAKVSEKDKVLLIGCGICPSHTILIAQETKAKVIGIDNSKGAVNAARKYVKKHELSDIVKIEYGDGRSHSIEDFNVVFIAANVWPIDDVLTHLSKNTRKGTRVLCKSIGYDVPTALENTELNDSSSIDSMTENPKTQTYLLVKK